MAYLIPIKGLKGERGPVVLAVILTKENWDRLKESDPFDVQLKNIPLLAEIAAKEIDLVIAYEPDESKLREAMSSGDPMDVIQLIERGRVHRSGDARKPWKWQI